MATKTAKHTPATKPVSWRVCVFTFWHPFGRQADPKGAETTPQAPHKETKWAPKRHNSHPPRNQFRGGCAFSRFGTHLDAKRSPKGVETTLQAPHKETKWAPKRHSTHPPRNHFRGGCAFSRFGTHFDAKRNPERAESEHNAASGRGVGIVRHQNRKCTWLKNGISPSMRANLDTSMACHERSG